MIENVTAQGIGCLIFGLPDGGINAFAVRPARPLEGASGLASHALLPAYSFRAYRYGAPLQPERK